MTQRTLSGQLMIMRNWLALDLGTECGFAIKLYDIPRIGTGTIKSKTGKKYHIGFKIVNFAEQLKHLIVTHGITDVAYEKVRRHLGTDAAHVYGAFEAAIYTTLITLPVSFKVHPIEISSWKKRLTGKGNADKALVMSKLEHLYNNHNIADAVGILTYAMENK